MLQEQEERKDTVKREHHEDKFYLIYNLNLYIKVFKNFFKKLFSIKYFAYLF